LRDGAAVRAAVEASLDPGARLADVDELVRALGPFTAKACAERLRDLLA
jgi:hypothetical protein